MMYLCKSLDSAVRSQGGHIRDLFIGNVRGHCFLTLAQMCGKSIARDLFAKVEAHNLGGSLVQSQQRCRHITDIGQEEC